MRIHHCRRRYRNGSAWRRCAVTSVPGWIDLDLGEAGYRSACIRIQTTETSSILFKPAPSQIGLACGGKKYFPGYEAGVDQPDLLAPVLPGFTDDVLAQGVP